MGSKLALGFLGAGLILSASMMMLFAVRWAEAGFVGRPNYDHFLGFSVGVWSAVACYWLGRVMARWG